MKNKRSKYGWCCGDSTRFPHMQHRFDFGPDALSRLRVFVLYSTPRDGMLRFFFLVFSGFPRDVIKNWVLLALY